MFRIVCVVQCLCLFVFVCVRALVCFCASMSVCIMCVINFIYTCIYMTILLHAVFHSESGKLVSTAKVETQKDSPVHCTIIDNTVHCMCCGGVSIARIDNLRKHFTSQNRSTYIASYEWLGHSVELSKQLATFDQHFC